MGNDATNAVDGLPDSCGVKVHRLMCVELSKFVHRISQIFPAIESARPRCTSGIESLCSLNTTIEKANLLIQHCTESSKLYLVITGEAILQRCQRIRNGLEQSLCQISNMVPIVLASQISEIVDDLRQANFIMDSSEEEAGKVILSLFRQESDSSEASEFEAFRIAALTLQITSSKSLLIEKRSAKKLHDKFLNTDDRKEKILKYLLYLLRKYGKLIVDKQARHVSSASEDSRPSTHSAWNNLSNQSIALESYEVTENEGHANVSSKSMPPEEYICPLSRRLMHDPVVLASGQTFERVWIEKWLSEGHNTCPKTQKLLSHLSLTPNFSIKDLISKWCSKHATSIPDPSPETVPATLDFSKSYSSSSIASFGSDFNDVPVGMNVSSVSFASSLASCGSNSSRFKVADSMPLCLTQMKYKSHSYQPSTDFIHDTNSGVLSGIATLPWELQCRAVGDLKNNLKDSDQAYYCLLSDNFVESLIRFLKEACDRHDVQAQKNGAKVLLASVSRSRTEIPAICEDIIYLMMSFLDSEIAEEALAIMEVLSAEKCCESELVASGFLSYILKILNSQATELRAPAIRILHNLLSDGNTSSSILDMEFIPKLIPLLSDRSLAEYCLKILTHLCNTEEGRNAIADANGCITSITELLEDGTHEQQEHGLAVLLSLCSDQNENCQLVLKEGVIPPLVNISVNGNTKGKESAMALLQILRDVRYIDSLESSASSARSNLDILWDYRVHSTEKQSSSMASRLFGKKMRFFSKPRSLALF